MKEMIRVPKSLVNSGGWCPFFLVKPDYVVERHHEMDAFLNLPLEVA